MTYVRLTVGSWGAIVEGVGFTLGTRVDTFLENIVILPEFFDLFFSFDKI